jgi:hypothetical protein
MLFTVAQEYLKNVEKLTPLVLEQYTIKLLMNENIDLNMVQKNETLSLNPFFMRKIFSSKLYSTFTYYYPEEGKHD